MNAAIVNTGAAKPNWIVGHPDGRKESWNGNHESMEIESREIS